MSRHLMLVPSTACPANCLYCFGPHASNIIMGREVLDAVVNWLNAKQDYQPLDITFHGGEPLVPGAEFYRMALPLLRQGLMPREIRLSVQSNLWLLTDELCDLFRKYEVSLGTSLDGPQSINDTQRGEGYFHRTMSGVELARKHGLDVGFICTFTPQSAQRADEVFDFFVQQGLSFNIHASVDTISAKGARQTEQNWSLSPEEHAQVLTHILDRYLDNTDKLRIGTLDSMCRSVSAGNGGICTFGDCLGEYLSIAPNGDIYTCQRFIGQTEFCLGNVLEDPKRIDFSDTPVWRLFQNRQECVAEECEGCAHFNYCRGGCPYNVLAANGGKFNGTLRDPHCPAYQKTFDAITQRAMTEVFSEENLTAVVNQPSSKKYGLLRKGQLIQLMRGGPHPQDVTKQARKVVASVALAVSNSPGEAMEKLNTASVITDPTRALQSLTGLHAQLKSQSQGLVNAYLHVTYGCNLTCDHCYASSGPHNFGQTMPVEDVRRLVQESARAGFSKAIITGGEPLMHPDRDGLLNALAELRQAVKPLQIVLRTNLAYPLSPGLTERLLYSVDQIVVSIDGDQTDHDARRGTNSYLHTVANLRTLISCFPAREQENGQLKKRLVLASTLPMAQMDSEQAQAVHALAEELGVGVRFKPVLPLGRALSKTRIPEFYSSLDDEREAILQQSAPRSTCGLGMNLYIAPDGQCYPCYALTGAQYTLGNALEDGLIDVLCQNNHYRRVTVDNNQKCSKCELRYLCGGFCRAWSVDGDPNAAPVECEALQKRAYEMLIAALETLNISTEQWQASGLPLPVASPVP